MDVCCGCDGGLEALTISSSAGSVDGCRTRMRAGRHCDWTGMSWGGGHAAGCVESDGFCAVVGVVGAGGVGVGNGGGTGCAGCWVEEGSDCCHCGGVVARNVVW